MASELKPWKYEIKYGPEGEDAYSWVYDDHGAMVATMKTHKAKEVVDRMNTPVAPVSPDATGVGALEGPFGWLNGHRALPEDSWTLESAPLENNEEYFLIPLYAKIDPFKEMGKDCQPTTKSDATGKCGELVTVRNEYRWGGDPKWKPFGPIFDDEPRETRELVTRSQADELLAAERARYVEASQRATNEESLKDTMHRGLRRWKERAEKAEADNAALTARVRELDSECNELVSKCNEIIGQRDHALNTCEQMEEDKEALEAKLAAAEKALEPFAEYCGDHFDKDFNGNPLPDEQKVGWVYLNYGHFRRARAVMGGKPS